MAHACLSDQQAGEWFSKAREGLFLYRVADQPCGLIQFRRPTRQA